MHFQPNLLVPSTLIRLPSPFSSHLVNIIIAFTWVKPFYVIALFVTMVTSLAVLWKINLSSPRVAFYLSRCSLYASQKASWGVASVFCPKESSPCESNCIQKSSKPSGDAPWKLLGAAPFLPLGVSLPK